MQSTAAPRVTPVKSSGTSPTRSPGMTHTTLSSRNVLSSPPTVNRTGPIPVDSDGGTIASSPPSDSQSGSWCDCTIFAHPQNPINRSVVCDRIVEILKSDTESVSVDFNHYRDTKLSPSDMDKISLIFSTQKVKSSTAIQVFVAKVTTVDQANHFLSALLDSDDPAVWNPDTIATVTEHINPILSQYDAFSAKIPHTILPHLAHWVCQNIHKWTGVEGLLKIVDRIPTLYSDKTENQLADHIVAGAFGTNPVVITKLVSLLYLFKKWQGQLKILKAIQNGIFGTDSSVRNALRKQAEALVKPGDINKMFGILIQVVLESGSPEEASSYNARQTMLGLIAEDSNCYTEYFAISIHERLWGSNADVIRQIIDRLSLLSSSGSQQKLAKFIATNGFGDDPKILGPLIEHLSIMTDKLALRILADSISDKMWYKDPKILVSLAGKLSIFQQDIVALQRVASQYRSILNRTAAIHSIFPAEVLVAFSDQLHLFSVDSGQMPHFGVESDLATTIRDGLWGDRIEVWQNIAKNLSIFSTIEAQMVILTYLKSKGESLGPVICQAIRTSGQEMASGIRVARSLDPEFSDRREVSIEHQDRSFSTPSTERLFGWLLQVVVSSDRPLSVIDQINGLNLDRQNQLFLAHAIQSGMFGIDRDVLVKLAGCIPMFTDPESMHIIVGSIQNTWGTDRTVIDKLREVGSGIEGNQFQKNFGEWIGAKCDLLLRQIDGDKIS